MNDDERRRRIGRGQDQRRLRGTDGRTIVRRAGERRPTRRHSEDGRTEKRLRFGGYQRSETETLNRRGALGGKVGEVWVGESAFRCGEENVCP